MGPLCSNGFRQVREREGGVAAAHTCKHISWRHLLRKTRRSCSTLTLFHLVSDAMLAHQIAALGWGFQRTFLRGNIPKHMCFYASS